MIKLLLVILSILFMSCRSITVTSQYNREVSIDDYMSFNWIPGIFTDIDIKEINPDAAKKIQNQTFKEMTIKGFTLEKEQPEIFVNIEAIREDKSTSSNVKRLGFSYWNGYDSTQVLKSGDLVIELIDANTETVIWQSKAQNALSGDITKEEKVSQILKQMFGELRL